MLDKAGAEAIRDYRIAAEANTGMAADYAAALDEYKAASASLVEAGRAQHTLTQIQREILAEERRQRWYERAFYWSAALIVAAAAL